MAPDRSLARHATPAVLLNRGRTRADRSSVISTTDSRTGSFWRVYAIALAAGAVAFLTLIPLPFGGDQALFAVIADAIDRGAVLYRDIWDLKQPGIYVFYLVAGKLFGLNETGVHMADMLLWLGFAAGLGLALRRYLSRAWLAALAPALLIVTYALIVDPAELTQVENIAGPLVFAAAWFALDPVDWGPKGAFLGGIAAGVALCFKFIYGPVIAAIWVAAALLRRRRGETWQSLFARLAGPAVAGAAIPLLILLWWVIKNDLVDLVRFTYFEYPPQEAALAPRPIGRFFSSLAGFFVPLLIFVIPAGYRVFFGKRRHGWDLSVLMTVWVVAGLLLFLVQPWWGYYLYFLYIPLFVLALQGVDDALDRYSGKLVTIALVLLALPALALGAVRVIDSVPALIEGGGVEEFQRSVSGGYDAALDDLAAGPDVQGATVYIMGNPNIQLEAGATQTVRVNGWSSEYWTSELWEDVTGDLSDDPPEALFMTNRSAELAAERWPEFIELVESEFDLYSTTATGSWHVPSS